VSPNAPLIQKLTISCVDGSSADIAMCHIAEVIQERRMSANGRLCCKSRNFDGPFFWQKSITPRIATTFSMSVIERLILRDFAVMTVPPAHFLKSSAMKRKISTKLKKGLLQQNRHKAVVQRRQPERLLWGAKRKFRASMSAVGGKADGN
jgi:hypothetical protein